MATLDNGMADIEKLTRIIEDTEIAKTAMEMVLMNPHLDFEARNKYVESLLDAKNRIKYLRRRVTLYLKEKTHAGEI